MPYLLGHNSLILVCKPDTSCFFPIWLKLSICFFRLGEKQNGLHFQFAFSLGKSKMVKTSNQAIFILLCFRLGATLREQETAQSGQFAQTSNLLFPGPGKSKMV